MHLCSETTSHARNETPKTLATKVITSVVKYNQSISSGETHGQDPLEAE